MKYYISSLVKTLALAIFFVTSAFCTAQTTIWSENFSTNSNNDITGDDNNAPAGADWTTSCSSCNLSNEFRVESGEFRVQNTDEYAVWQSELITITGYSNIGVTLDIDMDDNDLDATDCLEAHYSINNGSYISFPVNGTLCGDGLDPTVVSVSGLSGNNLRIRIRAQTTSGNERIHFDNIVVSGTVAASSLGKDGPGGVGETDGTGELAIWLKAEDLDADGITTDNPSHNSRVSAWNDHSGNNQHYTQTGNNRPRYQTTGSFNSVYFNATLGTAQYMNGASSGSYPDGSAFFVFEPVNSGVCNSIFDSPSYSLRYEQTNNTGRFGYTRYGIADYTSSLSSTFGSDVIASFHKSSGSSSMRVRRNSSTASFSIGSSGAGIPYDRLGRNNNGADEISGYFYEIIVYEQRLNEAERVIVENYLSAKYGGISISNDLYTGDAPGNGNYDYEVTGIGQASDGSSHEDAEGNSMIRIQNPSSLGNNEWLFWGHNNDPADSWGVTDLPAGIQSRLARDWTATETGNVGTVDVSVDLSGVAGAITTSDLRLLVDGNGVYASGATAHSGASHLGGRVYQWTGITINNNNHFTVGSINASQTPLPVELVKFEAKIDPNNEEVHLLWITSSEVNNDYFTVEKTKDLVDFEEVAMVPGQGTTNAKTEYYEVDQSPFKGISYYRLSQTDFDGSTEYFDLSKVEFKDNNSSEIDVKLYPNPNNGERLYIQIPNSEVESMNVLVNDFLGKEFMVDFSAYNHGDYTLVSIDLAQKLKPGTYIINIETSQGMKAHKLIVE